MTKATKAQIVHIYELFIETKVCDHRRGLVAKYTLGRTVVIDEMYYGEADKLIKMLSDLLSRQKMLRQIIDLAAEVGFAEIDDQLAIKRIDRHLNERDIEAKGIRLMNIDELTKVFRRFKAMHTAQRNADLKKSAKAVRNLLRELKIQII